VCSSLYYPPVESHHYHALLNSTRHEDGQLAVNRSLCVAVYLPLVELEDEKSVLSDHISHLTV
jgi:hypothetical protein